MTLATLFEGQGETLARIVQELAKGRLARDIAEELVEPVLGVLEANAGQALDPTYCVYMVDFMRQAKENQYRVPTRQ